eukprot:GFUD01021314.1.p1 GENE.GFUD01021314.1~~GFUD01021314.1.p1  ORF type:complete len:207 (-),score=90.28 GFUD01021314.1:108-728(-)
MSDTHTRHSEAGVAMTLLVARRVMQEMDGEEMELAAGKLKKVMEGYVKEEDNFNEGRKVLMEMKQRLGKVSGGDWPDVEKEYKQLVNSKKEKVVVENHEWWKKLEEALQVEDKDDNDQMESGDDDLEMTQVERNTVCPISRREMVKPVKNILCGHVYDKGSMEALLNQNPKSRCPVVGCPNKAFVVRTNLREDKETKRAIAMKKVK